MVGDDAVRNKKTSPTDANAVHGLKGEIIHLIMYGSCVIIHSIETGTVFRASDSACCIVGGQGEGPFGA